MPVFPYRASQICPSNKLAMFLVTKGLAMRTSTDTPRTVTAPPTVPSAVTLLLPVRAIDLTVCAKSRDAVPSYRHTTVATC